MPSRSKKRKFEDDSTGVKAALVQNWRSGGYVGITGLATFNAYNEVIKDTLSVKANLDAIAWSPIGNSEFRLITKEGALKQTERGKDTAAADRAWY